MKKLRNKLFQDLKLDNAEIVKVIGGKAMYSSCGADTTPVGGGFDQLYQTCTDGTQTIDNVKSDNDSSTTTDKPICP
jgi:hypothetical protein